MNPKRPKVKQEQLADVIDMKAWLWDHWKTADIEAKHADAILGQYDQYDKRQVRLESEMAYASRWLEGGMPLPLLSTEGDREYDDLKGEEL